MGHDAVRHLRSPLETVSLENSAAFIYPVQSPPLKKTSSWGKALRVAQWSITLPPSAPQKKKF